MMAGSKPRLNLPVRENLIAGKICYTGVKTGDGWALYPVKRLDSNVPNMIWD